MIADPPARHWRPRGLLLLGAAILLAAVVVVAGDAREFASLLERTEWSRVPLAIALTTVSYAGASGALVALGAPMGVAAPVRPMLRIALLSVSVNNLVSFGGVAGYSLRAAMSKPHGVSAGRSLAMSLTHAYLNNLVMFLLLAVVLLRLGRDPSLDDSWRRTIAIGGVLALSFVVLSTVALFSGRARGALVRAGARLVRRLSERAGRAVSEGLEELDEALGQAAAAFRRRPLGMGLPVALLCLHWAAMASAFWACIRAFSADVGVAAVSSGFSIGAVAGFASLLPGGVGVQDGSQAAVLTLHGVSLEVAVLGALLFRLVYYVMPFVLMLPLYAPSVRGRRGP